MAGIDIKTIVYFILATVPTLLWLWFWLKEDELHPEPKLPIFVTFVAGGLVTLLILPLESFVSDIFKGGIVLIILIAAIEEITKLIVVATINFKSSYVNERVDYPIYMISGAMGFAMAENILFFLGSAFQHDWSFILFTTNMRFLGATVLHGLMAAILGIIIGYAHYNTRVKLGRIALAILGLLVVTTLHAIFNYFIIDGSNMVLVSVLGALWIVGIIVLFFFERTHKHISRNNK